MFGRLFSSACLHSGSWVPFFLGQPTHFRLFREVWLGYQCLVERSLHLWQQLAKFSTRGLQPFNIWKWMASVLGRSFCTKSRGFLPWRVEQLVGRHLRITFYHSCQSPYDLTSCRVAFLTVRAWMKWSHPPKTAPKGRKTQAPRRPCSWAGCLGALWAPSATRCR